MRIASTLLVSLSLPAAAGAQTESLSASAITRVVVKTGRIPVKVADGRAGWVEFDLAGPVGGRPTGSIRLALGRAGGSLVTTVFQVSGRTGQWRQMDYDFQLEGAASDAGSGSSRRFTSRLTLARGTRTGTPAPGGVEDEDTWSVQRMADGDVWIIGSLTCWWSGTDLVCS